jgi:N6-L-threonylcarbamoyladenine synthase
MLGLGYPGGPVIERLSETGDSNYHLFPRPLRGSKDLHFSYSGLKTSFLYFVRSLSERDRAKHLNDLAASFQEAVFDSLLLKLGDGIKKTGIKNIALCGGVSANTILRTRTRALAKKIGGSVVFPPYKNLYGDNAAMIGIVASYKAEKGLFVKDPSAVEREPRASL